MENSKDGNSGEKSEQRSLLQNRPHCWVGGQDRHTWLVDAGQLGSESAPAAASSQYRDSGEGNMVILKMQCHFNVPSLNSQIKL